MKTADKIIRSIPRNKGNIPVPAIRKVPMGILEESRAVTAPKRKMTIPPTISSLFILCSFSAFFNTSGAQEGRSPS
jgi:hypothetical protein